MDLIQVRMLLVVLDVGNLIKDHEGSEPLSALVKGMSQYGEGHFLIS